MTDIHTSAFDPRDPASGDVRQDYAPAGELGQRAEPGAYTEQPHEPGANVEQPHESRAYAEQPREPDAETNQRQELAAEAARHRELLRPAVENYRQRIAEQAGYLAPADRDVPISLAERQIERLLIDPVQHAELDLAAYRAVRDRLPMQYDADEQAFVLRQPGQSPRLIRPGLPEHRLGVIARLAQLGVPLEQMQIVAITTASSVAPHEAAVPPARTPTSVRRYRRHYQQTQH